MRRYICNQTTEEFDDCSYDAVVVGGGLAGIYTALCLPQSMKVLLLLKRDSQVSSSWFAQGGVAAVIRPDDNFELHTSDTLTAGAGLCDPQAVKTLVTEGPEQIERIIELGVPVDMGTDGAIECGREGGHSRNRIVHCGKDATGRMMVISLTAALYRRTNITVRENCFVTDILTGPDGACGLVLYNRGFKSVFSPNIVLATGGIGRVYKYTTNPATATGDGIAAAARAGAVLKNMEFVQFHPTAFAEPDVHGQHFLISEAVRGDGGLLYTADGERIMQGRHPLEDLAPRDIVAREIFRRMRETDTDRAYLDIKYRGADFVKNRFPTIYKYCLEHGVDITQQLIPVVPAQHYFMGGVAVNLGSRSTVPGLYVVGETSCTGVHGANRLASNSLLECLVFGARCAQSIAGDARAMSKTYLPERATDLAQDRDGVSDYRSRVRSIMSADGGIVRNGDDLEDGIKRLDRIITDLSGRELCNVHHIEVLNMAQTGRAILAAALKRKGSVGAHFREDTAND